MPLFRTLSLSLSLSLSQRNKDDLEGVARVARAHHQLAKRNELIVLLLDIIQKQLAPLLHEFLPTVRKLAGLNTRDCGNVVLKARQLIMATELPSNTQRKIAIQTLLNTASAVSQNNVDARRERLAPLIDQSQPIEDMIFSFFEGSRPAIQTTALEAYIRRIYQVYSVPFLDCQAVKPIMVASTTTPGSAAGQTGGKVTTTMEEAGPTLIGRWHFNMDPWSSRLGQEAAKNHMAGDSPMPLSRNTSETSPSPSPAASRPTLSLSRIPSSGPPPAGRFLLTKSDSVSDLRIRNQGKKGSTAPAGSTKEVDETQDSDNEVEDGLDEEQRRALQSEVGGDDVPAGRNRVARASVFNTAVVPTTDSSTRSARGGSTNVRQGVFGYFTSFDSMKRGFQQLLPLFDTQVQFVEPVHVLYVALKWGSGLNASAKLPADDTLSGYLRTFLSSKQGELSSAGVRRVTFIISTATPGNQGGEYPAYFTFRHRLGYEEDTLVRHIEPITAAQLDLERLSNFDLAHIATTNRMIHLFAAYPAALKGKGVALHGAEAAKRGAEQGHLGPTASTTAYDGRRIFIRTLVRKLDGTALFTGTGSASGGSGFNPRPQSPGMGVPSSDADLDAYPETEFAFVEALNALEIAMHGDASRSPFKLNAIFLNVLVEAVIDATYIEAVIRLMARRYSAKVKRLHVAVVEFNICIKVRSIQSRLVDEDLEIDSL